MYSPESRPRPTCRKTSRHRQQGVSIIELLVGLTIGLLVVAAALGTLLISRGTSASVTDMSQLQQQGSYALRVIGMQFRQAGSIEVIKTPAALYAFDDHFVGFDGGPTVVTGSDGANGLADKVSVSNQPSTVLATQRRDCLGTEVTTGIRMDSTFYVDKGQLYCKGTAQGQGAAPNQPVIGNVADFQVSYRVQTASGTQAMTATAVEAATLWPSVTAIEICLDLQGAEGSNPNLGSYQTCQLDSKGAAARASRAGRLHLVYRNVFDLRTQGL
jgi:type IV pilus assembly protein PilW